MKDLFERYRMVLQEVDAWFASCIEKHGSRIACRSGCSSCCRGLFDITLLDALFLKSGFDRLPDDLRQAIRRKAQARLGGVQSLYPAFGLPWLLNDVPEEEWDRIMPDDDEAPCVMLSDEGACLLYTCRPMTCRLNGLPLIDCGGDLIFDEWCTLNFTDASPLALDDLRHSFYDLFAQELLLFHELTRRLVGRAVSEIDTVIPAVPFLEGDVLEQLVRTIRATGRAQ